MRERQRDRKRKEGRKEGRKGAEKRQAELSALSLIATDNP